MEFGSHFSRGGSVAIADIAGLADALDNKADLDLLIDTGIITGGNASWSGSGLVFNGQASTYRINGTSYSTPETIITLDAADSTNPRIDRLVLTASGWEKRTGTPAASPAEPDLSGDEIPRQIVLVEAGATAPSDITLESIYLENTEWSITSSASFNPDSTNNPKTGTKCIECTNPSNNDFLLLDNLAAFDLTNITILDFWILSKGDWGNRTLNIQWLSSSNQQLGTAVTLADGRFSFTDTLTSYQHIIIPIAAFQLSSSQVPQKLRFRWSGNGSPGCHLDDITAQEGISATSAQNAIQTIEADNGSYTAQGPSDRIRLRGAHVNGNLFTLTSTFNITLTDAATIETDASIAPIFNITLGGNRTVANPTNTAHGMVRRWFFKQDTTGGRSLVFGDKFRFPPTVSTIHLQIPGAVWIIDAFYDSIDDSWWVFSAVNTPGTGGPLSVPNLESWWDASQITGVSNGSTISQWPDFSGNNRHATQVTGANQPTFVTNVANGLPVIRFANPRYLNVPNFLTGFTAGEVFCVMKAAADPGTNSGLWEFGSHGDTEHWTFSSGGALYSGWGSTTRFNTGDPSTNLSSAFRVCNVSSASGAWTVRINGVQHYTTASNTVGFTASPKIANVATTGFFDGDIAEIFIFSRTLTVDERDDMTAYCSAKYGLGL